MPNNNNNHHAGIQMHCVVPAKSVQMNGLKPILLPSSSQAAQRNSSSSRPPTNREHRKGVVGGRQNTEGSS